SNVTINFLLPGTFETERLRSNMAANAKNRGISIEQARSERMATVPAKRFGTPDEFGAACAFLCSAQAGYITGQNLLIDGGVVPGAMGGPKRERGRLAPTSSHPPIKPNDAAKP